MNVAILKIPVNGEMKQMEVYSIAELLQVIDVKQKVIEALLRQNAELKGKVNGEKHRVDQESGEPGSTTGG